MTRLISLALLFVCSLSAQTLVFNPFTGTMDYTATISAANTIVVKNNAGTTIGTFGTIKCANTSDITCSPTDLGSSTVGLSFSLATAALTASNSVADVTGKTYLDPTISVDMPLLQTCVNDTSTGTTANRLVIFATGNKCVAAGSATTGIMGITYDGAATSGNSRLAIGGVVQCYFSGATTAGQYAVAAGATGQCSSTASPTIGVQVLGDVLETIGGAGLAKVRLRPVNVYPSTSAATETLTNKTLDAEGTGNAITIPVKVWLPAAGCQNATATLFFDTPTSSPAVAACITGTNTQKGVADFADSASLSMQTTLLLPSDWTGNIDAKFKWLTTATSGSVVWQLATSCVADAETDDPSWNTASTVTDAAKGTTNQTNDASITNVTATGCAAGELLHIKVLRDAAHASDDLAATARLIGLELTLRRAM